MSKTSYLGTILFFVFFATLILPAGAEDKPTDIVIGQELTIKSKILGEERALFISTPRDYDQTDMQYPVMYVLDGRGNFQFSAAVANFLARNNLASAMIVVGIPNTNRNRDFTPTAIKAMPNSGGADKFIEFMKTELIPFIDTEYRTHSYRILVGHSLCGMFSVYTMFTAPDLFQSHIAISPYLQYDEGVTVKRVRQVLQQDNSFSHTLFLTLGDEPGYLGTINKFTTLLKENAPKLTWKFKAYDTDTHESVVLRGVYDGLEYIYSDWQLRNAIVDQGINAIKSHYKSLARKYGFNVKPTEALINNQGYRLMNENKLEVALSLLKWNTQAYPNSANVYDSYGEAFEQNNQYAEALKNYKIAIEKGKPLNDPNMHFYKEHVARVKQKMGETM